MKKPLLKVASVLSSVCILGLGVAQPALGNEFSKSGSIVEPHSKLLEKRADSENTPSLSDDVLVVKYKTPLSQSDLQRSGLILVDHFPSLKTVVVKLKDKKKMDSVIRTFSKQDRIESIHPSALYKPLGYGDPKSGDQYYLQMLNIQKAQGLAGKEKIRIAVIDQGIDMNHPELKGKLLPSYSAVNPMSAGLADFHGTHVAGIIASEKNNGVGGYGINPNVEILPIDVFDRSWWATDYAIADGILHAIEKKAKVINLSLGGSFPSQIVKEAIKKAIDKDIVVVAAAGNTGDETLSYPASYEGVISVGNITEKKKRATDSSYGPAIDVVAPGSDIYNTIYDYEKKSTFAKMSGTSMASPVVAGVASLLLSKNPSLKPAEVEYILKHTADDLGERGFDIEYGYGLINPIKALQFDRNGIPDYIKNGQFARDKAIDKAEIVSVHGEHIMTSTLTKPQQENWVKLNVKAGQTIQLQLKGAKQFDYKLMGKWLNSKEEFEVNEVGHGVTEGTLLQAKDDGILALGVKDVHSQYDDSGSKQSSYELRIVVTENAPADESNQENPIIIPAIPSKVEDQTLYAPNGEKDEDYYVLKVDKPQIVKIAIGGLPGVDSAISVYHKMNAVDLPPEMQVPELMMMPIKYENRKGKSEGETLLFSAVPDVEYMVKVSNQPDFFFGMYEFFMDPSLIDNQAKPKSSLDLYDLTFEGFVLPEDEDGYSMGGILDSQSGLIIEQQMLDRAISYQESEQNFTDMIKSIAVPISSEDVSGYLQMEGDQDWYQFVAESDGLYKLDLGKGALKPTIVVNQITKEKMNDKEFEYFSPIGSNNDWWSYNVKDTIDLSLEKGKTYFVRVEANYMNYSPISMDPYQFQLKKVADINKDPYEPNDKYEEAKDLKANKVTSTFAKSNDTDVYYFKAKESAVYGLSINPLEVTKELKAKYPESVLQPYYSYAVMYEDKNKNRKLDDAEMESAQYFEKGIFSGKTFGSFNAKKDAQYFVAVSGYFQSNASFSLRPYELSVQPIVTKDEDPQNTGVSLKNVKPIKLSQQGTKEISAKGYFNTVGYGDEDWYSFTMKNSGKASITLELPPELDGQIELYHNGKLVQKADHYLSGDSEVLQLNLNKGEYWIKLKEANNQTSLEPYKLKVKFQ